MASVFLTTTTENTEVTPYARSNYERMLRSAAADRHGKHRLVDSPEDADLIVFVESRCRYHGDIRQSQLYRQFRERCFVFDSQDRALPSLPGLYVGATPFDPRSPSVRGGFYIRVFDNGVIEENAPLESPNYLMSFVGSAVNAPMVRNEILNLPADRAYLRDSSTGQSDHDKEFALIIRQSKFVLCPRGIGPSTWRLFETMRAGRCPVIIADDWMPPPGVRWEMCSLRIPETEIHTIPLRLAEIEDEAEMRGKRAFEEWERNFSLGSAFHWTVESLLEIENTAGPDWRYGLRALRDGYHRTPFLKETLRRILRRKR